MILEPRGLAMRIPVPDELLPAAELGRVHFVGIGGAGLSAIARIMARNGVAVSGSDDQDTPFLPALRELGVTCHLGYAAAHVGDADTVVVTTAAREDNPEVARGPSPRPADPAALGRARRHDGRLTASSPSPARTARPRPPAC